MGKTYIYLLSQDERLTVNSPEVAVERVASKSYPYDAVGYYSAIKGSEAYNAWFPVRDNVLYRIGSTALTASALYELMSDKGMFLSFDALVTMAAVLQPQRDVGGVLFKFFEWYRNTSPLSEQVFHRDMKMAQIRGWMMKLGVNVGSLLAGYPAEYSKLSDPLFDLQNMDTTLSSGYNHTFTGTDFLVEGYSTDPCSMVSKVLTTDSVKRVNLVGFGAGDPYRVYAANTEVAGEPVWVEASMASLGVWGELVFPTVGQKLRVKLVGYRGNMLHAPFLTAFGAAWAGV